MKIYKYYPPERTDVLRNLRVRFTQPAAFNDPFDVLPNVEKLMPNGELEEFVDAREGEITASIHRELERTGVTRRIGTSPAALLRAFQAGTGIVPTSLLKTILSEVPEDLRKAYGAKLQRDFGGRFGVFSLSEVPSSLLMWAHYAASYRGFVIEYEGDHPFFNQRGFAKGALARAMKVSYALERPAITMFSPKADAAEWADVLIRQVLLTKSVEWGYEREWRMVLPLDDQASYPHVVVGDVHLFPFPAEAITAIVLGPRSSDETTAEVTAAIASTDGPKFADLRHAVVSDSKYEVSIERGK